jgi:hypothetical protein
LKPAKSKPRGLLVCLVCLEVTDFVTDIIFNRIREKSAEKKVH